MCATFGRFFVVSLPFAFSLLCAGQAPPQVIVSTSQIAIRGGGFEGQTLSLTKVSGDWFAAGGDAHANLDLETAPGPQHVIVQLQWDGPGTTHTITHDTNETVVGTGHSTFYLMLPGDGINNQAAAPHDSDVVTVTVTHMDDNTLEARLAGTATTNEKVRFSGTIALHRTGTHAVSSTGGWHDCDAQIHDKMVGAENRSPSECEARFDRHVREALQQAFVPVIAGFTRDDWAVAKEPHMGPVTGMARHSENAPYRLSSAHEGNFAIHLALKTDSPAYQRYAEAFQKQMAKMQEAGAKDGGAGSQQAIAQMAQTLTAQEDNTKIEISVSINSSAAGVVNYRGNHELAALPGGGSVLFVPAAQSPTGGGSDAAQGMTWVLLGAWGVPAAKSLGSDGEHIDVKGGLRPGKPQLAVQNVWVRIRSSRELAQKVIDRIDWNLIRALLQEN